MSDQPTPTSNEAPAQQPQPESAPPQTPSEPSPAPSQEPADFGTDYAYRGWTPGSQPPEWLEKKG